MPFDPINRPHDADYILLGGQRSPGLATVVDLSAPRRWDERRGAGQTGATIVFNGVGLARWKVRIRLYTAQDWEDWHAWKEIVVTNPAQSRLVSSHQNVPPPAAAPSNAGASIGGVVGSTGSVADTAQASAQPRQSSQRVAITISALEIAHPILEDLGITSCVVEDIKGAVQTGHGEWTIEIAMVEYRLPVPTLGSVAGVRDSPSHDPADAAINNLVGIIERGGRGNVVEDLAPLNGVP